MSVSDFQDDVDVTESRISGKLNYVTGLTDYSDDPELQEGHFLVLKFEATEDAVTTTQLIGVPADEEATPVDENGNCVVRIVDPLNQKLKVVSAKSGLETTEKIYRLSGLKLLPAEA